MNPSPVNPGTDAAHDLLRFIRDKIPLARAMDLELQAHDDDLLVLGAPLAPNVNDKGCAFGGSMASLLTVAGWGLIVLNLRTRGIDCDVYVGDSRLRYHEPVWGELRGVARFSEAGALDALFGGLRERGKGRADVTCEIAGDGRPAATLEARFVAKLRA